MTEVDTKKPLKEHVADLVAMGMRCNCDLDNWEPTRETGHSPVCRIHKTANERFRYPVRNS
jgi:hypothetical protein